MYSSARKSTGREGEGANAVVHCAIPPTVDMVLRLRFSPSPRHQFLPCVLLSSSSFLASVCVCGVGGGAILNLQNLEL